MAQIPIVSALGYSAAIVVLIAVITAVTLLPALLSILGKRIDSPAGSLPAPAGPRSPPARLGEVGPRRRQAPAARHARSGVAILVVLAIPVLNLQLGQQDNGADAQVHPDPAGLRPAARGLRARHQRAVPDRRGLRRQPGPQRSASSSSRCSSSSSSSRSSRRSSRRPRSSRPRACRPTRRRPQAEQEVSSQPPTKQEKQASQQEAFLKTPASDPRLVKLENQIGKTKGVKDVSPATLDKSGDTAVFTVIATTAPSANTTEDLVGTCATPVIPDATKGTTLTAYVGGQTAGYIDLADRISDKLPLVIVIVIVLSFLLLTARLPLDRRAAHGWAHEPALGGRRLRHPHVRLPGGPRREADRPRRRDPDRQLRAAPDVRDPLRALDGLPGVPAHRGSRSTIARTSDNHEAVVDGLAVSARVITSAALIMVSVYTSFILNGDPTVKQFGLGLAVAIAVDATVVRCLLVPAVMVMLGRANWWLPKWTARVLPRVGIEGDDYFRAKDAAAAAD